MTESLTGVLEEIRHAVVYMQVPIVGFLAIANFQTRRAQNRAAFALAGYGWIFNLGYIALSSGLRFVNTSGPFGFADPFHIEVVASSLDVATDGLFVMAFLAANGTRLLPPKWFRLDILALVLVMGASWFGSALALSVANRSPVSFAVLSLPLVVFSVIARVLLGRALFEQTKMEVPVHQGPIHLYVACLFYASIQPLYLLRQMRPGSQTLGFVLGFVAKAIIALGFVKLFSALASKFAGEQRSLDTARRILGRIRHELNTPLGEMKNWIDAAIAETNPTKLKNYLERMESATQRSLAITSVRDDILYQAIVMREPSADRTVDAAKEVININNLIQTAILAVKATRSEELNWQLNFAAGNCIYCSREQVIQVLVNVLRNAYDAMPKSRGRITITTAQLKRVKLSEEHRFVRVSIRDDGEGFDQSIRDAAFDDGFSTREGSDRGHGLFVVRQLLAVNGGSLEVVSPWRSNDNERPGTEITILFPRVRCGDGNDSPAANRT